MRTAPNYKALDLVGTKVALKDKHTLRVTVDLADTTALGGRLPAAQNDGTTLITQAKYLVRWDYKGQVYYAGVNVPKSGETTTPTFFSGAVVPATGINAAGATPDTYYGVSYKAQKSATGQMTRKGFVIDIPISDVGGSGRGASLMSVGSYAMLAPPDGTVVLNTLPITVDSTPTFDTKLK